MANSSLHIDLEKFKSRFQAFGSLDYAGDFKGFWKWKVKTEKDDEHVLDGKHRNETYRRLCNILPGWLTYRPYSSSVCLGILESSLAKMVDAYNQVRHYSLLEFSKTPTEPLELIWHELGRAKEEDGDRNPGGFYSVVAVTKPLMFLWGQTLAFDSLVRSFVPKSLNVLRNYNWVFNDWKHAMNSFQDFLREQPEVIDFFKKVSLETYGTDSIIPYGQFIDLYYWVAGKECGL